MHAGNVNHDACRTRSQVSSAPLCKLCGAASVRTGQRVFYCVDLLQPAIVYDCHAQRVCLTQLHSRTTPVFFHGFVRLYSQIVISRASLIGTRQLRERVSLQFPAPTDPFKDVCFPVSGVTATACRIFFRHTGVQSAGNAVIYTRQAVITELPWNESFGGLHAQMPNAQSIRQGRSTRLLQICCSAAISCSHDALGCLQKSNKHVAL